MAAKSAEQHVEYALKHFSEHHKTAGRIVQELRAAGWLREANEIPALVALEGYKRLLAEKERELCPGCYDRVTELTRERDEARVDREAWARAYRRALATAASPEVMRVVEAAKAWRDKVWSATFITDYERALRAAVDALSASRQPKAQEPRYVVRDTPDIYEADVFDSTQNRRVARFYGAGCSIVAHSHAARLNGEGGGK